MVGLTGFSMVAPWFARSGSDINTVYGRRTSRGLTSVNGTSVFANMFEQRGSRVTTWMQLSPRLQRSDVIVWTPNSFELPTTKEIEYLEDEWLGLDDGRFRTLIYIARDYDAAAEYWSSQANSSKGSQFLKTRSNLARAQSDHAYARSLTGKEMDCEWFSVQSNQRFVQVESGDGAWAGDINLDDANISVAGTLKMPEDKVGRESEILLSSDKTPLIVRVTDKYNWPDGQVIVVLNGASVLNLPLVNYENRKIAAKLIDECRDPVRVTFLESNPSGLRVSNQDPNSYSGFEALTVWPINVILLHLVVAGILFCTMVFPIFGRPREIINDTPSNFGKHIRAMGELLSLSDDRDAAIAKVRQYRNLQLEPTVTETPKTAHETGNPFKV